MLHIMIETFFEKEVGSMLSWEKEMRYAEHEETSSEVGDLDDFIFSGEEWYVSER